MAYEYSNTKLASNTWSLPNIEVFATPIYIVSCDHCRRDEDEYHMPACFECGQEATLLPLEAGEHASVRADKTERIGFWYWHCFPGCMPESDAEGPFASYETALAHAREQDESED